MSAESVGLTQKFGKYQTEVGPGLHFKIPFGVDKATLVPVKRQLKEEFGFGTSNATYASQISAPTQWQLETTMVTGDLNTALVEWIIQQRAIFLAQDVTEQHHDFLPEMRVQVAGRLVDERPCVDRRGRLMFAAWC